MLSRPRPSGFEVLWQTEEKGLPENHNTVRSAQRWSLPQDLKENSKRRCARGKRLPCRATRRMQKRKHPKRLELVHVHPK